MQSPVGQYAPLPAVLMDGRVLAGDWWHKISAAAGIYLSEWPSQFEGGCSAYLGEPRTLLDSGRRQTPAIKEVECQSRRHAERRSAP